MQKIRPISQNFKKILTFEYLELSVTSEPSVPPRLSLICLYFMSHHDTLCLCKRLLGNQIREFNANNVKFCLIPCLLTTLIKKVFTSNLPINATATSIIFLYTDVSLYWPTLLVSSFCNNL